MKNVLPVLKRTTKRAVQGTTKTVKNVNRGLKKADRYLGTTVPRQAIAKAEGLGREAASLTQKGKSSFLEFLKGAKTAGKKILKNIF